jgi:plastocyanin
MKKLALPALGTLAAVVAALAATAGAATVTVSITKNGYVPKAVTIKQGDTVQFANSDSVPHQVAFRSTTGVTCSANPLVVQPGASASCTFATAGSYSFDDPNVRGNTYRGTITVEAPSGGAVSIAVAAQPQAVVYGAKVTVSGVHSSQSAGETIDILAQPLGATAATKVATVQTTTGGAFTASVLPRKKTAYTAKSKNVSSRSLTVAVKPRLKLTKPARQKFALRVTASTSFAGKYATLQRYNTSLSKWVLLRRVLLRPNTSGVAPTAVTSATFKSTVKARTRIRVLLPQLQVGPSYLPGLSNVVLA